MAVENTPESHRIGLIHHSDRGVQYCCKEYVKILRNNNIPISIAENGDFYENALAERVNGILKSEWLDYELEQANNRIYKIINIYNTIRPHSSCDMLTPEQAQSKVWNTEKRW